MTPFQEAVMEEPSRRKIKALARSSGRSMNQVRKEFANVHRRNRVFVNDRYQVFVETLDTPIGGMYWLSIKRLDKETIHDWRELQEIKNQIVGPEHEGVELYPAESRKVDTSNQYHLFVFAHENIRFPFGFTEREVVDGDGTIQKDGTRQRPLGG